VDKKDLKTAKEIELVENRSIEITIETQDNNDVVFGNQSVDDTDGGTTYGDATVQGIQSDDRQTEKTTPVPFQEASLVGKIVGGHYEILSLIGHGGMSRVYKAKHLLLRRNVALKFLAVGRQFDAKSLARFQKEAEAAAELQHTNICSTREFGVNEDGIPFLVMDYVEGTSLGDILSTEKKLSKNQAIEIMTGLCAGLEHAHAQGVIHRDIKPANIILTKDKANSDIVKIVDFGIAKLIREDESGPNLTQTGEVFGTPKYMSPEQCLGSKVDQRADIYALGCIFYEMLAGHPPFCDESAIKILFAHVNDQPPALGDLCGKEIQAIVRRCLEKDASKRYQNVSELLTDLQAVKDGRSLIHARQRKEGKAINVKAVVVFTTVISLLFILFTTLNQAYESSAEIRKQWDVVHSQAATYKQRNDLVAAEKELEKSLEIAKTGHEGSIIALTLQELSEVESALGRASEAQEHKQALEQRIKRGDRGEMSKFFFQIATLLIGFGILMSVFSLLAFSKHKNKTLAEIFSKKK
jgi:serine/threonine protein kinase